MVNYKFHPTLILRTPVYNSEFYSDKNLANVLKQSFFQKAIYFASESFYNELKKNDFDFNKLDKKGIVSIKKYFNRMCYRPTPFGIYAAVGSLKWDDENTIIQFEEENLNPYIKLSYAKMAQYGNELLQLKELNLTYKTTPAIYKSGNEYRVICSNQGDSSQIDFIINSVKTDRFFNKLLGYVSQPHTFKNIAAFVINQTRCTDGEALTYIQWLIEHQIITNSLAVNITGEDYIKRLLYVGSLHQNETYSSIKEINDFFCGINNVKDLEIIPGAADQITDEIKSSDLYVNLKVSLHDARLNTKYQKDIRDGLDCLNRLVTQQEIPGLQEFIRKFSQKFENQTIPLLEALDPEIGIDYGDLAVENDSINIINEIQSRSGTQNNTSIKWNKIHAMFFNKWKTNASQHIIITADDLKGLDADNSNLAPSISVMFRVIDDQVLIESAGGATATALIGRFTPFDDAIKTLAKDIASNEALNNHDIVFAEIAHICNSQTANIDRREHIYQYEIPILIQSTMSEEHQIQLSDLWVSVVNGEIILQSKRLGKRVVPRLSSAFNYTRNDLAVFRFLCDLQHAGVKTNLNFNLNRLFPNLNFYPRVIYKNTILQLAYWTLTNDIFAKAIIEDDDKKHLVFGQIRQEVGLPKYVGLTQHDNQLVFNFDNEDEVSFFLDVIKNQSQFTLKEYLLPGGNAVVTNEKQEPHVSQFIASLYAEIPVYKPITTIIKISKQEKRKIIPGEDWLYFKLYCHPIPSNELLGNTLFKVLKKLMKDKLINQYFFIRYLDPGYHIRLRLKVKPGMHQQILSTMHISISKYVEDGIINNYSIATYERELERYHPEFMVDFENAFYASSHFVLSFLKHTTVPVTATAILNFAVSSVNDIIEVLDLQAEGLTTFLDSIFNSFAKEFNDIADLKYLLDTAYRKQKGGIELVMKNQLVYYQELNLKKQRLLFRNSLAKLKSKIENKMVIWQQKWVADLIHMHLNRLFTNDSRKQEMAVYYFLSKYHRSMQSRVKKS